MREKQTFTFVFVVGKLFGDGQKKKTFFHGLLPSNRLRTQYIEYTVYTQLLLFVQRANGLKIEPKRSSKLDLKIDSKMDLKIDSKLDLN